MTSSAHQVFISHSSTDTWIAKQIANYIGDCGAACFLDESSVQIGDDFEEKIREAASASGELLVLLTPWAVDRPYIWLEMGAFWGSGKRIVGVLHGLTKTELLAMEHVPGAVKRIDLINLNDIDSYFIQLKRRMKSTE
jgi:hypothetical protein